MIQYNKSFSNITDRLDKNTLIKYIYINLNKF